MRRNKYILSKNKTIVESVNKRKLSVAVLNKNFVFQIFESQIEYKIEKLRNEYEKSFQIFSNV